MSTYLLVHGSWHGGWCWDKVAPFLEQAGHKVETPDLPGHGNDKTPISEISLQSYVDRVNAILEAQTEPVILVGHSMGGAVISLAAEQHPEKAKTLVYVTGYLVPSGETILQQVAGDTEGIVIPNLVMAEDGSYATIKEEVIRPAFYHDCSDEDVARAKALLAGPHAVAPLVTPINLSEENFGRVPRVYIECTDDRALVPAIQRKMYTATPCDRIIPIHTSHSPFLAAPQELASHLLSL